MERQSPTISLPVEINFHFKHEKVKSIKTGPYRSYAILQDAVLTWGKTFIIDNSQKSHQYRLKKSNFHNQKSIIQEQQMNQSGRSLQRQGQIRQNSNFLNQSSVTNQNIKNRQLQNSDLNKSQSRSQNQSIIRNSLQNYKLINIPIKVNRIVAGLQHTFAYCNVNEQNQHQQSQLKSNANMMGEGGVYCWGSNLNYQLGIQGQAYFGIQKVDLFDEAFQAGFSLRQISCGERHTIAILEYLPKIQKQLAEEEQESHFSKKEVKMSVWGQSKSYQLTLDTTSIVPYPVMSQCNIGNIKHIYSKSDYNIALLQNGQAYSWGSNMFNRLGLISKVNKSDHQETIKKKSNRLPNGIHNKNIPSQSLQKVRIPKQIQINQKIIKIGIGVYHAIALTQTGKGFSWGSGLQGQLGINKFCCEAQPTMITTDKTMLQNNSKKILVKDVSCGEHHSLILDQQGQVYSCGSDIHGCLGHQRYEKSNNQKKKRCKVFQHIDFKNMLQQDERIVKISCGYRHNLALTNRSKLLGWGSNHYHQITPIQDEQKDSKHMQKPQGYFFHPQRYVDNKASRHQNEKQAPNQNIKSFQQQCLQWKYRYLKFKKDKQEQQCEFMQQLQGIFNRHKVSNKDKFL